MMNEVRIGLLGLGTVGAGVVKVLDAQRATLEERAGCRLRLGAIADVDVTRRREGLDLAQLPMTTDAARVLDDPSIHIVIELVGGLEPARSFILKALAAGKHVVTANKALLAHHGAELYDEARRRGMTLAFEAAVAGGIPLIRAGHPTPARLVVELGAVVGEQRLVGGDHVLAGGERAQDERARGLESAHQLDHDVHAGVAEHAAGVAGHRQGRQVEALARAGEIGVGDGGEGEPAPGALLEDRPTRLEDLDDAAADGAEAEQCDPDVLHVGGPAASTGGQ